MNEDWNENSEIDESEVREEKRLEKQLESRRNWLKSLSQEDRNFIAEFGEERWRRWKAIMK